MRKALGCALAVLAVQAVALVSFGVALGVVYMAPGPALTPQELIGVLDSHAKAITQLSQQISQPAHTGEKKNASLNRKP